MNVKMPDAPTPEVQVLEALAAAVEQHGRTVQLAQLGRVTRLEAAEIRAYQRSSEHPLGLVLDR